VDVEPCARSCALPGAAEPPDDTAITQPHNTRTNDRLFIMLKPCMSQRDAGNLVGARWIELLHDHCIRY
jgi:hypothetical protein